jgi:hypothetical protein
LLNVTGRLDVVAFAAVLDGAGGFPSHALMKTTSATPNTPTLNQLPTPKRTRTALGVGSSVSGLEVES